jgi:hypothetical protein
MLETTCSPCGVVRTASGAVFPSDPGAPLGHRKMIDGSAAIPREYVSKKAQASRPLKAVSIPESIRLRAELTVSIPIRPNDCDLR